MIVIGDDRLPVRFWQKVQEIDGCWVCLTCSRDKARRKVAA